MRRVIRKRQFLVLPFSVHQVKGVVRLQPLEKAKEEKIKDEAGDERLRSILVGNPGSAISNTCEGYPHLNQGSMRLRSFCFAKLLRDDGTEKDRSDAPSERVRKFT